LNRGDGSIEVADAKVGWRALRAVSV